MGTTILAVVLGAVTPILLAIIGFLVWLYRREWERRYDAEQRISESKIKTYTKLVTLLLKALKPDSVPGRRASDRELIKGMSDAQRDLFMYGSDDVLQKFSALLQKTYRDPEGNDHVSVIMGLFAELLVALRKDLGNSESEFSETDLLRMLITDFDEARKKGEI